MDNLGEKTQIHRDFSLFSVAARSLRRNAACIAMQMCEGEIPLIIDNVYSSAGSRGFHIKGCDGDAAKFAGYKALSGSYTSSYFVFLALSFSFMRHCNLTHTCMLSERDICTKFITPALKNAGWDIDTQVLEEVSFTDGKIYVRGKLTARGKRKRADYILYYRSIPVAIIEAKDDSHSVNAGIQQALEYARILDIPSVFSSNGNGFLYHDKTAYK